MPELPEVEATRQNLARWSEGGTITRVVRVDERLDPALGSLVGTTFLRWVRHGKVLAGVTENGQVLSCHLGMTGRWVRDPERARRSQRLVLELTLSRRTTRRLAYLDVRCLGDARLMPSLAHAFAALGPDAWREPLDPGMLKAALGHGTAPLKVRLLDQKRIAGLGNIAVSELCFRARVHPHTRIDALPPAAFERLVPAIRAHLEATLASTIGVDEIVYVSEGGDSPFAVYGRAGHACPGKDRHCRGTIVRAVIAGRASWFCPDCQPEVS